MKNVLMDAEGDLRCWKCGSRGFTQKRTARSKAIGVTAGVALAPIAALGILGTKKKLRCQACGEYNDVGSAQPFEGSKAEAKLAKRTKGVGSPLEPVNQSLLDAQARARQKAADEAEAKKAAERAERAADREQRHEEAAQRAAEKAAEREAREAERQTRKAERAERKAAEKAEKLAAEGWVLVRAEELKPGDFIDYVGKSTVLEVRPGKLGLRIETDKGPLRGIPRSTEVKVRYEP